MRFGFNFGFLGSNKGGGFVSNLCMTSSNDGVVEWHGYEYASYGSVDPEYTEDNLLMYAFKYKANGDFIFAWGPTGTSKVGTADTLLIQGVTPTGDIETYTALWDNINSNYIFNNLNLATGLISNEPSTSCVFISEVMNNFIYYTFEKVETA